MNANSTRLHARLRLAGKGLLIAIGVLTLLSSYIPATAAPPPPARKGPWSPVAPAPVQPPARPSVTPVQPIILPNNYAPGAPVGPGVPDPPVDAPGAIAPAPVYPAAAPPPFELPQKGTVMEDKYTAPQYRKAGKEYESILAEEKGWHSVWGRVSKAFPGRSLVVKGFYCSKRVESPAYILTKGLPVPCTFLLTNCPQTHVAGETLKKVYRAKFLGQAAFRDEVSGSNYLACVFDHGIFPIARAKTNSVATSGSASKL